MTVFNNHFNRKRYVNETYIHQLENFVHTSKALKTITALTTFDFH